VPPLPGRFDYFSHAFPPLTLRQLRAGALGYVVPSLRDFRSASCRENHATRDWLHTIRAARHY
jgi:hypothetical protein